MVDAVAGRAALAVLTGSSTADQYSGRKNPVLPSPLNSSQQAGGQRANAILRFDRPQISRDVFNSLQNAALLSVSRAEVSGDERIQLEQELNRRIIVSETPGSSGSPGTPDTVNTVTVQRTKLDAAALTDLQTLLQRFSHGGSADYSNNRLVKALSETLQDFGNALNSDAAGKTLGEIIGRIDSSVIGRDGLRFSDLFRDPGLFATIGAGLSEFAQTTGSSRAAGALGDVILRIGDPRLGDDNRHNDSTQALESAVDRLGRALAGNDQGTAALGQFLDRLRARGRNDYSSRISTILSETLSDLQKGTLDQQAVQRLQTAVQDIGQLDNVPGRHDDRLRAAATTGLQAILDRYVATTTRTETTVTPGTPAVAPSPPTKTVTVVEATTLVPRVEIAQRVVTTYQAVQEQIRPLQKLAEPLPPTLSLQALVQPPETEDRNKKRKAFGIGSPADPSGQTSALPDQSGNLFAASRLRGAPGQFFDARA